MSLSVAYMFRFGILVIFFFLKVGEIGIVD